MKETILIIIQFLAVFGLMGLFIYFGTKYDKKKIKALYEYDERRENDKNLEKIKELNKKHDYVPMECPCCGKYYFGSPTEQELELFGEDKAYERLLNAECKECGWKYDLKQTNYPDSKYGKNLESLNEYKEKYKKNRYKY